MSELALAKWRNFTLKMVSNQCVVYTKTWESGSKYTGNGRSAAHSAQIFAGTSLDSTQTGKFMSRMRSNDL